MTPHHDGVPGHENEPDVVAEFDIGPVELQLRIQASQHGAGAGSVVATAAAKLGETYRTTRGNRRRQRQGQVASCRI
jgi:hypothetical protein